MSNTATTTECHFCNADDCKINANHWTGAEYIRTYVCNDAACRDQLATAPRQARRPRPQRQVVANDYNMLCAFVNGRKAGAHV